MNSRPRGEIFNQWIRAEPDFKPRTAADSGAWTEGSERTWKAESQRREEARLARILTYDRDREAARLPLLRAQAAFGTMSKSAMCSYTMKSIR